MHKIAIILILLLNIVSVSALTPTPAEPQAQAITLTNATLHIGDGRVLKNASLSFENGKITQVGYFKSAATGKQINLQGQHVYPGLILLDSDLGLVEIDAIKATKDSAEEGLLNPEVRSIIAYNTDSERIPTMRFNGVLLSQVVPSGGLVSGTSSVVQLDAWNWEDAIVKVDGGLHLNWPSKLSKQYKLGSFGMELKPDKKYRQKVTKIKQLFADAKTNKDQTNLKLQAVKPVFSGGKKLYIHSNDPKAIIESVNYFQSIGITDMVLVSGQATAMITDFIAKAKIPVIIRSVHDLPQLNDSPIDAAYQLPKTLRQAGILTAIAYQGSMSARNLPFVAGTAAAYGVEHEQALSMITLNAAAILGIDKHYGSLELGKSATFFITSEDGLDMRGNRLQDAYIDGRKIQLNARQQQLYQRFKDKYKK